MGSSQNRRARRAPAPSAAVSGAGLTTAVQPTARAGATLRVIIAAGKFHGVIAATTPGIWLDMAESELGVFSNQCLDCRIPDKPKLIEEVAAWEETETNIT